MTKLLWGAVYLVSRFLAGPALDLEMWLVGAAARSEGRGGGDGA